ncbi:MAG: hypothetical protein WKG01_41210 [Kofleriaceae bacterium]
MRACMIIGIVALTAAGAAAQAPSPAAEGARLFEEGRALVREGRYAEACDRFAQSYQLDRAPGTQLNLGDCAQREGQLRRAWLLFDDAARSYQKAGREVAAKHARGLAVALEPRLATVIVKLAEPQLAGLALRIGDHAAAPASQIVEHLEAGTVTITATAPGREPFTTAATGELGKQVMVEIPVLAPQRGPIAPLTTQLVAPVGPRDPGRVKLAIGFGITGVATVATSTVLGLLARRTYKAAERDDCVRMAGQLACTEEGLSRIDRASARANLATAIAIGGGALVAVGAILYVTAPRERLITPIATSNMVGLTMFSRF